MLHWTMLSTIGLHISRNLVLRQPLGTESRGRPVLGWRVESADKCQGLVAVPEPAIELRILYRLEDLLEAGSGLEAHLFRGRFGQESADKFIVIQHAMARNAIQPVQRQMLLKARQAHEALQRRRA